MPYERKDSTTLFSKGSNRNRGVLTKTEIIASHAKKTLKLTSGSRNRIGQRSLSVSHLFTHVGNWGLTKLTLCQIWNTSASLETWFLPVSRVHNHIIEIDTAVWYVSEHQMHQPLKSGRGISHAKKQSLCIARNGQGWQTQRFQGTCQYPLSRSNFVITAVGPMLSMQSSMRGSGNESGTVTALTLWKSGQKRGVPSELGANKHGELQGLWLGLAKPFSNKYSASLFIISLLITGQRYACCLIGAAEPTSKSCRSMLVRDGTSLHRVG